MAYLCGTCNLNTSGSRCLLCRSCDIWYHADCEDVTKTLFSTLDKNRNLAYTCKECMVNPPDNSEAAFKVEIRKEFASLKSSINLVKNDQLEIKSKVDSVINEVRAELSNSLKEIKDEMAGCKTLVNTNDMAYKSKFAELESQNHILQHRLNRADVVITGLPTDLKDLSAIVSTLCGLLKVDVVGGDIVNAMYIKKRRAVLVKFSLIAKRDKIISEYYKFKSLKASDVVEGATETRIYLNDNYSSLANKLMKMCWKLKKEKKINGYGIINRESLLAKITTLSGSVKTLNYYECINHFNLNPQ